MRAALLIVALAAAFAAAGCGAPPMPAAEPPAAEASAALTMPEVDALGDRYNAARLALAQAGAEGRLDIGAHGKVITATTKATLAALEAAAWAVAAGHEGTTRQWYEVARRGVARMEMYLGAVVESAPASWREI